MQITLAASLHRSSHALRAESATRVFPPKKRDIRMGRIVIQRVKRASVTVDGQVVGAIGRGLLVLVGLGKGDEEADLLACAKKIVALRLWDAEGNEWKRNVVDSGGEVLLVSQFTLFARVNKGTKPVRVFWLRLLLWLMRGNGGVDVVVVIRCLWMR